MWLYNNEEVTKENFPKDGYGFIYMMGAIIDGEKKFYIGKFQVNPERKVKLNKTEMAARPSTRHKDWKTKTIFQPFDKYYSSNDTLIQAHEDGIEIKRIILHICKSKRELTFEEIRHMFKADVLSKPEFLNDNILGKFYRGQLYPELETKKQ